MIALLNLVGMSPLRYLASVMHAALIFLFSYLSLGLKTQCGEVERALESEDLDLGPCLPH